MESYKVQSYVGADGVLHLEVPTRYANADLEIEVKVSPSSKRGSGWPPHFFSEVIGSWQGEFPPREQGDYEVRQEWT